MSDSRVACFGCVVVTGVLLLVILLPLSFSYVEYYEYGLAQRKSTGSVNTDKVYSSGRYLLGVDRKFIKYQADAHYNSLEELSVFSAGGSNESIGLAFLVDIDYTYFLIEEEIGALHQELASNYNGIIASRAREAIKNEAIFVTFTEYFQNRTEVEERFRQAVDKRWRDSPSLHCKLDQFHLGRIQIPDSVASKQLQTRVQNERNDKEALLQQAQLEREATAVAVNAINLERDKVLRTAEAEASLTRAKARANADRLKAQADINGTRILLESSDISTQDHKTTFTYIRTLRERSNLKLGVSYLSSTSVIRTQAI